MLEAKSLTRRFPGKKENALDSVSFTVHRGECIVISGANGSGKSVLMRLIAGLDKPTSGSVSITAENGMIPRVGLVFQDADAQILGDTIGEDVAFGPKNLGFGKAACAETVRRVLGLVGLSGREQDVCRTLSGGEKRRLAVAGILAMESEIIIFDEPFANLDWPGVTQVNGILGDLVKAQKTVIILTHELEKVLALAGRLMVLFRGRLVFDGSPRSGLEEAPLESWGIRNPLVHYNRQEDLLWSELS